jgi:mono/diheme cytochrome c family protein
MQHRIVRRVSLGLAAGLAAAAWLFALALRDLPPDTPPSEGRRSPEAPGAAAFARHCESCHEAREWSGGPPDAAAAAAMVTFLDGHGEAPLAEDLLIVQWLVDSGEREPMDQLRTK